MESDNVSLFESGGIESVSIREFARQIGVSDAAIHKAVRSGRLSEKIFIQLPSGRKRINLQQGLAEWEQLHGEACIASSSDADEQLNRAREETLLTMARRREVELRLMEAEGQLHYAEDVRLVMNDMIGRCKARLRSIPPGVAPLVVRESDTAKVQKIISDAVNEALRELSEYDPGRIKRQRNARRRKGGEE